MKTFIKNSKDNANLTSTMSSNRNRYTLLYFYSTTCGYCERQDPILSVFEQETGWYIKPVDVNEDQMATIKFGIQSTPSLVMIERNSPEWILISSTLLSLPEIKDRIVRSIDKGPMVGR